MPSLAQFCILHLVIWTLLQLVRCMPVEVPPFIESPLTVILLCPFKLIGADALYVNFVVVPVVPVVVPPVVVPPVVVFVGPTPVEV